MSFTLSFAVGFLYSTLLLPRPHIFSAILLLIEVFFLEKFTRTEDTKFLIPLPLVSVALINFHAAMWLMSLVVCLPFLFVKNFRHIKFLLAAMIGIFLFGLINPYGLDAMTYVFRSYGVELINENIAEMGTPTAHALQGKCFYVVEAFLIFSLARKKIPWRYVFLCGGITSMAIMHARNLVPFYFLATFPLAHVWHDFTLEKFKSNRALMTALVFLLVSANTAVIVPFLQYEFGKVFLPLKILFFATMLFMLYNLLVLKVEGRILYPTLLPRKVLSLLATLFIVSGIFITTVAASNSKLPCPYTDAIKFLLRTERPENILLYTPQGAGGHFRDKILYRFALGSFS